LKEENTKLRTENEAVGAQNYDLKEEVKNLDEKNAEMAEQIKQKEADL